MYTFTHGKRVYNSMFNVLIYKRWSHVFGSRWRLKGNRKRNYDRWRNVDAKVEMSYRIVFVTGDEVKNSIC